MNHCNSTIQPGITIRQLLTICSEINDLLHQQYFGYEFPGDFNCRVCPMAESETLEQAAKEHGINEEE